MRIEFGSVTADFASGEIFKNGKSLSLPTKEAELLRLLVNHRGQVVRREKILGQVWRESPHITPRTVDVHIAWLRQKIEEQPDAPRHIATVRGEGYRFQKQAETRRPDQLKLKNFFILDKTCDASVARCSS